jgi:hypothetical protein
MMIVLGGKEVSPNGVVALVTKLRKIRAPQVNWNQCLTCGSRFDYEIGKGPVLLQRMPHRFR